MRFVQGQCLTNDTIHSGGLWATLNEDGVTSCGTGHGDVMLTSRGCIV